jgi:hypothetical protein
MLNPFAPMRIGPETQTGRMRVFMTVFDGEIVDADQSIGIRTAVDARVN